MKFKFIEHRDFSAFGIDFPAGEFVEVKDEAIAKKLAGNKHFISGAEKASPKVEPKVEAPKVVEIEKFTSVQDVATETPIQKRRARKSKG